MPTLWQCFAAGWTRMRSRWLATSVFTVFVALCQVPILLVSAQPKMTSPVATLYAMFGSVAVLGVVLTAYLAMISGASSASRLAVPVALPKYAGHALSVIGATVLVTLLCLAGFLLFIVPGVYIATRLAFTWNVLSDDHCRAATSLSTSWRLTRGHSLRIFVLTAMAMAPSTLIELAYTVMYSGASIDALGILLLAISVPLLAISSMVGLTALMPLYERLRGMAIPRDQASLSLVQPVS